MNTEQCITKDLKEVLMDRKLTEAYDKIADGKLDIKRKTGGTLPNLYIYNENTQRWNHTKYKYPKYQHFSGYKVRQRAAANKPTTK